MKKIGADDITRSDIVVFVDNYNYTGVSLPAETANIKRLQAHPEQVIVRIKETACDPIYYIVDYTKVEDLVLQDEYDTIVRICTEIRPNAKVEHAKALKLWCESLSPCNSDRFKAHRGGKLCYNPPLVVRLK